MKKPLAIARDITAGVIAGIFVALKIARQGAQ